MDWTGCEFVECVPGKMSGVPVVVGTRVPPETFVEGVALGMSLQELQEDFPSVSLKQIEGVLAYAHSRQSAA
jgi:uncharacterized protein (DUF433 family)